MARILQVLAIIMTGGLAYLLSIRGIKAPENRLLSPEFKARRIGSKQDFSVRKTFKSHPQALVLVFLLCASIALAPWLSKYRYFFQASLVGLPQIEFTGTTYPVKQVPIWTELTAAERLMTYNQIPNTKKMQLPAYDLRAMRDGQEWEIDNERERNIYVTYPVPNLGNYQLDGTENTGSHPGIDIKLPIGTPIYSIASGVVYKTGNLSTGFGKSVSVAHSGVPDPQNPSQKITLVSTYAHLSQVDVSEGDIISKGQMIGESGNTGFATAPHLHFQVDRADAPFIPYWPFSWNDVQAAGMNSFFDAVEVGLGKANAERYTVHPFNLIARNANFEGDTILVAFNDTPVTDGPITEASPTPVVVEEPPKASAPKPEETEVVDPSQIEMAPSASVTSKQTFKRGQLQLEFETDRHYTPGKPETVTIRINEANLVASSGILISSTLKDRATVTPSTLNTSDFTNGAAEVTVKTHSAYPFKLVAKSDFGEIKSQSLKPEIFADVPGDHTFATAISFLKENDVVKGYADNTYRPDQTLNRAEALKIILESNRIEANAEDATFSDVASGSWFYNYVTTAFKRAIVKGYGDGTFKPGNTVSRAEFLKMAIATAGFDPDMNLTQNPYSDVLSADWHARYFEFAKGQNLIRIKPGNLMAPNSPITRGEAAEVIYKLSRVQGR